MKRISQHHPSAFHLWKTHGSLISHPTRSREVQPTTSRRVFARLPISCFLHCFLNLLVGQVELSFDQVLQLGLLNRVPKPQTRARRGSAAFTFAFFGAIFCVVSSKWQPALQTDSGMVTKIQSANPRKRKNGWLVPMLLGNVSRRQSMFVPKVKPVTTVCSQPKASIFATKFSPVLCRTDSFGNLIGNRASSEISGCASWELVPSLDSSHVQSWGGLWSKAGKWKRL